MSAENAGKLSAERLALENAFPREDEFECKLSLLIQDYSDVIALQDVRNIVEFWIMDGEPKNLVGKGLLNAGRETQVLIPNIRKPDAETVLR